MATPARSAARKGRAQLLSTADPGPRRDSSPGTPRARVSSLRRENAAVVEELVATKLAAASLDYQRQVSLAGPTLLRALYMLHDAYCVDQSPPVGTLLDTGTGPRGSRVAPCAGRCPDGAVGTAQ